MHGIKQLATLLACLSVISSTTTVLATAEVDNIAFFQRNLLDYSQSAAERSLALTGLSSSNEVSSLHVLKRRCKKKGKKHHNKKNHHHKHHHHHHHHSSGSGSGSSSSASGNTNEDAVSSSENCDSNDSSTSSTNTSDNTKTTTTTTNDDARSAIKVSSDAVKGNNDDGSSSSGSSGNVTSSSGSGSFQRVQQNRGSNFWSGGNWDFWSNADPTHGSVQFASENSAKSQGLIGMKNGAAFMRASNKDISGGNRPSVRFQSKKAYDSGLVIFDVAKMPVGCATWPALWTTKGSDWPFSGEIDVVEGVGHTAGGRNANQMTVHLGQSSPLSLKRRGPEKRATHLGKLLASNCNQWGGSNTGCAFVDSNDHGPSWGDDFNAAGGGVWAMQFGNNNGVKIWFWGRKSGTLPDELSKANVSPEKLDPSSWGTPMGNFQSNVINSKITAQNIIMDITIGGDWAGNVPMDGKCKGQSLSQAIKKGSNYDDAEFIINAIDIYCQNGKC
jgi:hypothetical protein